MNFIQETQLQSTNISSIEPLGNQVASSEVSQKPVLNVVARFCKALKQENINYCHWKSNLALDRSASGENDLDILIDRADVQRFTEILYRLGFKQAIAPVDQQMPGVLDYYGYDSDADRLVHVHTHYQLILGHDRTKNYRLPIEEPFLTSATLHNDLFRIPTPEFEFIIFVIRMVLKYCTWDVVVLGKGKLPKSARGELKDLQARSNRAGISQILRQHLPYIDEALFDAALEAIQAGSSAWSRIQVGHTLQKCLRPYARRNHLADLGLKIWRGTSRALRRRVFGPLPRKRMTQGGAIVAIVGGDGAGKSTAIESTYKWLSKTFDTPLAHMGKPPRSLTTNLVRGGLRVSRFIANTFLGKKMPPPTCIDPNPTEFPGYSPLLWNVCAARDRYLSYARLQRLATNGSIVISDRFPLPNINLMDAPQIEKLVAEDRRDGLINRLSDLEKSWYRYIAPPDILIVLRVDPEIAVQRKTDEREDHVRTRSTEVWQADWSQTKAHVVDAAQPKEKVLAEIKSFIWSQL